MAQPGTTYLELGEKDGLYFEYDAPSQTKPTLVFINALTGSTAAWQAVVAPRCREAGLGTLCWNFRGQADSPFSEELELSADLIRTSFFQNCKALISLSFVESEGSVTGYDPG
jgi:pimeloyl-ACP methyl ester carboxylesterase